MRARGQCGSQASIEASAIPTVKGKAQYSCYCKNGLVLVIGMLQYLSRKSSENATEDVQEASLSVFPQHGTTLAAGMT